MYLPGGGGAGAMRLLADVEASNETAVDMVGFSSIYADYVLAFDHVYGATANKALCLRSSVNGGSSFITAGSYYWDRTGTDSGTSGGTDTAFVLTGNIGGSSQAYKAAGRVYLTGMEGPDASKADWFANYGRVSVTAHGRGSGRLVDNPGQDAIRLFMSDGNIYGRFRLWGVK